MNEWVLMGIFLVTLFVGAILFPILREIKNKKDIKKLQEIGKKIVCKVTKQEHGNVLLNGYSLMLIELTPIVDNENKKYGIFKMKLFQGSVIDLIRNNCFSSKNYTNLLLNEKKNIGKEVNVWVNPSNHKDFVVNHKDLDTRRIKLPF